MHEDDKLESLIDRWEALRSDGHETSAEDICAECPELMDKFQQRIAKLKQFSSAFGDPLGGGLVLTDEIGEFCGGRYQIEQLHDQGGLGVLYLARDKELGRNVIVKGIRGDRSQHCDSRRQFVNEAAITGQLEHPGIVPVYGFGRDQHERPYYAMRMIRGMTLRDAIRKFHERPDDGSRNVEFQRLLRDFLSVCQTIHFAHSRGVIHRDIKPANIMLGQFGEVLVVDWGLAKHVASQPDALSASSNDAEPISVPDALMTRMGAVKGSPMYMSPEQAAGRTQDVGPPSDVYGLGATLYELLTGRAPFDGGSSDDIVAQVKLGIVPRPRDINVAVPPALEASCLKAMQREPQQRYVSAKALADDIESYLADEPVSAYAERLTERVRRWARRHRPLVTSIAATILVGTVGLLGASVLLVRNNQVLKAANDKTAAAEQAERKRSEELARSLYRNQFQVAASAWQAFDVERAESVLEACDPKQRALEWYLLKQRCGEFEAHKVEFTRTEVSTLRRLADPQAKPISSPVRYSSISRLVLSPDHSHCVVLATPAGTGAEWPDSLDADVVDVATGKVVSTFNGRGLSDATYTPIRVAISADNQRLAVVARSHFVATAATPALDKGPTYVVCMWDIKGGKITWHAEPSRRRIHDVAFLDSGQIVVAGDKESEKQEDAESVIDIVTFDAATGKAIASKSSTPLDRLTLVRFSGDGRRLAVLGAEVILNVTSGEIVCDLAGNRESPRDDRIRASWATRVGAFSPDGRLFAAGGFDRAIRVWETNSGSLVQMPLIGHDKDITSLAFSPDGATLVSAGLDRGIRFWNLEQGQETTSIPARVAMVTSLACFSDDRFWAGGSDGAIREFNVQKSNYLRRYKLPETATEIAVDWPESLIATVRSESAIKGRTLVNKLDGLELVRNAYNYSSSQDIPQIAIDRQGTGLAMATSTGLDIEDTRSGKIRFGLITARSPIAFSADGKTLFAVVKDNFQHTVAEIDAETGRERKRFFASANTIARLAAHPDGRHLAVAAGTELAICDVADGKLIHSIALIGQLGNEPLAFSPDGRLLCVGVRNRMNLVRVFSTVTWKELFQLEPHADWVTAIAFSPDSRRIITASWDKKVRIWDAETGQLTWSLDDARERLFAVAISPDGKVICAGGGHGNEGEIDVWSAAP